MKDRFIAPQDLMELKRCVDNAVTMFNLGLIKEMTPEELLEYRQEFVNAVMVIGPFTIYRREK